MRIAIFENIMTPGGHEVEFDRIITEELQKLGHEVFFCVPEDFSSSFDYKVPMKRLTGKVISYTNVRGLKKFIWSVRRELHRLRWYRQLQEMAELQEMDAIIVPTSTYRYLRALVKSPLRYSPVPVVFILHGINPHEAPRLMKAARKLLPYENIRMAVLTFGDSIFGEKLPNIYTIYPPTYTPRDLKEIPKREDGDMLKIGFFGQYRREKRLRDFLKVFSEGEYTAPVKLLVQGSTMHPEDSEDFEKIIGEYSGDERISFLHKGLIGAQWQEYVAKADALLMPYSAPRYLYHWGGMLFTAIGFGKPVVASDDINPEVFQSFYIGETFKSGDLSALKSTLECFVNNFSEKRFKYDSELKRAGERFSPEAFAKNLERLFSELQG